MLVSFFHGHIRYFCPPVHFAACLVCERPPCVAADSLCSPSVRVRLASSAPQNMDSTLHLPVLSPVHPDTVFVVFPTCSSQVLRANPPPTLDAVSVRCQSAPSALRGARASFMSRTLPGKARVACMTSRVHVSHSRRRASTCRGHVSRPRRAARTTTGAATRTRMHTRMAACVGSARRATDVGFENLACS